MWEYTSAGDAMRLNPGSLKQEALDRALATLLSIPAAGPPEDALPLFRYQDMAELVAEMPRFDR